MQAKRKGLDVTTRVYGKLEDGSMCLFLNNEKIGRMVYTAEGAEYHMNEGYLFEENRIYRFEEPEREPVILQYVEGCDQGWC
ncbi:YusG family protein [Bacillus marinisedimentorum]|uniref:YusG family protein n=1 Tax=Bacillus marinisedimentorum TaxID=1821260 RepID=UPI0007E1EBE9|nr:YusG family protein [Bacillus marinisedimentorum]